MTLTTIIICLGFLFALSISVNIILCWYMRKAFGRFFVASEEASEIFSRLDAYSEHLQNVYEMPTFYGDDTLQSLLEHSKETIGFLKRYETVYSFTQPDLVEQLKAATMDLENDSEENTTQTQE